MSFERRRRGFALALYWVMMFSVAALAGDRTASAQSSPPAISCPGGELKGCFTSSDQMARYLDMVTPLITDFFVTSYGASFPRPKIRYVKAQESGPTGCVDDSGSLAGFDKDAYFYCPPDHTVYVGEEMMWILYTKAGPIAPALGVAHEWGHHLQNERRVKIDELVTLENQADCVAGAWLAYANGKGLFKDDGDSATVSAFAIILGDVEHRSHGMDLERLLSFTKGETQGLADGCDQFSHGTPISPP